MGEAREPVPPEVVVRGGPDGAERPATPARPALRAGLLSLAALTVVAGIVLGSTEDPRPTRPDCPEPCLTPGSVVLGAALPLTGQQAAFGHAQRRGVERVLAEIDADGGLEVAGDRRRVELLVRDTRSQPDVAGQEALVLVRGPYRLLGLIGPCSPPVAMVRVAESRQVPLVTGCQPLPPIGVNPLRHTWEVAPGESERASAVFQALRTSPARRAGLFLSNDRSAAAWTAAAAQGGFELLGTYRPQGSDWSAGVAQAARDGVDVVVAVTQPPEGVGLWQELRRQGVEPRSAYASEAGLGSAWFAAVGPRGNGTLTDLVHPTAGGRATPEEVDEAVAAVSSELTRVLLDGVRRAAAAERPELRAALAAASGRVAGTDVRFLGEQASRPPVRLARWQDGRLVPLPS